MCRVAWLLLFSLFVIAQQQAGGIFGRVVNAETHEPVRRSAIKIYNSKGQWDEFTDGEGRFRFPAIAAGTYTLVAHRDGYSDRAYKIDPSDFEKINELSIQLHPQGIITGRVVDTRGLPLRAAQVQALGPQTKNRPTEAIGSAETNDLGEYRLSALEPGQYRLRSTYRAGRSSEFDPTPLTMATAYFGGAEKTPELIVKAGSSTSGIDFVLDPVQPATVRGTMHTDAGVSVPSASLWISGLGGEGGHNGQARDGRFEIGDVGPGTYTVSAQTMGEASPLYGVTTVNVRSTDPDEIDLVLLAVPRIVCEVRLATGISVDTKGSAIYFTGMNHLTGMNMQIGHLNQDRKFSLPLIPDDYLLSFDNALSKIGVQNVTLNGKPVTDWKFHIDQLPQVNNILIVLGDGSQ